MIKEDFIVATVHAIQAVICNRCGKECQKFSNTGTPLHNPDMPPRLGDWEFAEIKATWGYPSNKDTERHTAHLCEACYDVVVKDFKIPPRVENYLG